MGSDDREGIVEDRALRAAVGRIIPADSWPAGWGGGAAEQLKVAGREPREAAPGLAALSARLDVSAAAARPGSGFADLTPAEQDAVLEDIEGGANAYRVATRLVEEWPS